MAKTTNTWAWTSPGVLLRAMMAVVTDTAMIDPDCRYSRAGLMTDGYRKLMRALSCASAE